MAQIEVIDKQNIKVAMELLIQIANDEKKQIERCGINNLMSIEHQNNIKAICLVVQLIDKRNESL